MKRSGVRLSVARLSVPAEKGLLLSTLQPLDRRYRSLPGTGAQQKTRAVSHCPAKGQG